MQPAPSAWDDIDTTSRHAKRQKRGMERKSPAPDLQAEGSSTKTVRPFALTGRGRTAAQTHPANTSTNALGAARQSTEQTPVLPPRPEIRTPLKAEEWLTALKTAGILDDYKPIPHFITYGADAGISQISTTFAPPNHPSISTHRTFFDEIVHNEYQKGRYWGPYSRTELENLIGPFQTSPLSLIPKLGKPDKFRLIQNLSFPRNAINNIRSINSSIETDLYPCTWGTFSTVATTVWSLPPGSLGAC